jgi:hypothetical protein
VVYRRQLLPDFGGGQEVTLQEVGMNTKITTTPLNKL